MSPIFDLFTTILSMGLNGYNNLRTRREVSHSHRHCEVTSGDGIGDGDGDGDGDCSN